MKMINYLDKWSLAILLITAFLFIAALFFEGLPHDILIEAGVFLVSVKIIMMAYRANLNYSDVKRDLLEIKRLLEEKTR